MFKNQPKGLIPAALSNMGERFGFYIMMAILVLFLMSKFGLDGVNAGIIYSVFYFAIYFFAFFGGIIADKTKKYKGTITTGLVLMALGYLLIAIPTPTPVPADKNWLYMGITLLGLFTIAFGNGLFKGNLQAVVGQLYDNPQYSGRRDIGFSLFYMFINVGAIFAPLAGIGIRNWFIKSQGFAYNSALPDLCHSHLRGDLASNVKGMENFQAMAQEASIGVTNVGDLTNFANEYLSAFTTGYHYAFALAIGAMMISLVIFLVNKKNLPDPSKAAAQKAAAQAKMSKEDLIAEAKSVKQRIYALLAVFAIVIFFWFSFHQNGLTLTYFAADYTLLEIGGWNIWGWEIPVWKFGAEIFQSANPFFVVLLTPLVIGFFSWFRDKGKEISTPGKIAIGMGIAALAYLVMSVCSVGLPTTDEVTEMGGLKERITPILLLVVYFILTVAELFISPLGISFVSKVAPAKYQGMMQGLWLCATAVGNQLLFVGAIFYYSMPLWLTWSIFVGVCFMSMVTMLFMLKWLNRVTR